MRDNTIEPLNWEEPVAWTTGEEVVVIDGPSFDGGIEVRAPIEFCKETREASCTVIEDGTIAHPRSHQFPRIRNVQRG